MPAITINNVSDGLREPLSANSKAHHRSVNGEPIATLERALTAQRADPVEQFARIRGPLASLDLPALDPSEIPAAMP